MTATFERIKTDRITPHGRNVRRHLGNLDELVASIKGMGVLQPLVVAPIALTAEQREQYAGVEVAPRYVLIAGHRRLEAARQASVETVPCIVRDDLDTQAKQIEAMIVENIMRADLTVMEEADAYAQLELLGVKEAGIAKATGRSRATVHQRLLLAGLPGERREQYESGKLSLDGAIKCAKLREKWTDDTEILQAIDEASTYMFGSGAYGIERTIERILDSRKPAPEQEDEDDEVLDLDGNRAEREAEWKQQKAERERLVEARRQATGRMYDWLSGRLAAKDDVVARRLIEWAIDDVIDEYAMDTILPLVGIEPPGEDEDVDDANLRIAKAAKELSGTDRMVLLALAITGAASPSYWYNDTCESFQGLGYTLTADDRACLDGESS